MQKTIAIHIKFPPYAPPRYELIHRYRCNAWNTQINYASAFNRLIVYHQINYGQSKNPFDQNYVTSTRLGKQSNC